ncbi:TPA: ECF transporter S component [Candidatus Woesearchaeota archaeon]|nr:ECF transporter S component [Candidatus Woesearchaeota archaeon]
MAKKDTDKTRRTLSLVLIAMLILLLLSSIVSAQVLSRIGGGFKNIGSSIGNSKVGQYFKSYGDQQGPTFFDFMIFFIIFFCMAYLGFKQFFENAGKGPIIGLSVALGLALSTALVWGGKVTLKKLIPFALVFLALGILLLVYSLLKKFAFSSDSAAAKIGAFFIALIITLILTYLLISMVCFNNRCDRSPIMGKFFGSGSIFGKVGTGVRNLWGGKVVKTPTTPTTPGTAAADAVKKAAEEAAKKKADEDAAKAALALANRLGGNFEVEPAWHDKWWAKGMFIFLGLLACLGIILFTRHLANRKKAKAAGAAVSSAGIPPTGPASPGEQIEREKNIYNKFADSMKELAESLGLIKSRTADTKTELVAESNTFSHTKELAEGLNDVKETIGEELDNIEKVVGEAIDFKALTHHNKKEKEHVAAILDRCTRDAALIQELASDIDVIKQVLDKYPVGDEILTYMRDFDMKDTEEIHKIQDMELKVKNLTLDFQQFSAICESMLETLDLSSEELRAFRKRENWTNYAELVKKVMELRTNFGHLNQLFAEKVGIFKNVALLLQQLDEELKGVSKAELEKLSEFSAMMDKAFAAKRFKKAEHFADLIISNAEHYLFYEKRIESVNGPAFEHQTEEEINKLKLHAEDVRKQCQAQAYPDLILKTLEHLRDVDNTAALKEARTLEAQAAKEAAPEYAPIHKAFQSFAERVEERLGVVDHWKKLNAENVTARFSPDRIEGYKEYSKAMEVKVDVHKRMIDNIRPIERSISLLTIPIYEQVLAALVAETKAYQTAEKALDTYGKDSNTAMALMKDALAQAKAVPGARFRDVFQTALDYMTNIKTSAAASTAKGEIDTDSGKKGVNMRRLREMADDMDKAGRRFKDTSFSDEDRAEVKFVVSRAKVKVLAPMKKDQAFQDYLGVFNALKDEGKISKGDDLSSHTVDGGKDASVMITKEGDAEKISAPTRVYYAVRVLDDIKFIESILIQDSKALADKECIYFAQALDGLLDLLQELNAI